MSAKQPVYIRSDFDNAYVELTSEQARKLVEFARKLEKEGGDEDQCSCGESDVFDGYAVCEVHPDGN